MPTLHYSFSPTYHNGNFKHRGKLYTLRTGKLIQIIKSKLKIQTLFFNQMELVCLPFLFQLLLKKHKTWQGIR